MDRISRSKFRIEGINLQDVVGVMWSCHPTFGSPSLADQAGAMGVSFDYDMMANGIRDRHYLTGKYWRVWVDIGVANYNVREDAESYPDWYTRLVYFTGEWKEFVDFLFLGEYRDFQNDMLAAKMIGMIPDLPKWITD